MPNVRIWVRNPYPFRDAELLRKTIYRVYGVDVGYVMMWDAHYIDVDNVTITTARQIASSIKAVHLHKALSESRPDSRVFAESVEVEVRGRNDDVPEWYRKLQEREFELL